VFFLTDLWLPRLGGLERSIEYLVTALSDRADVQILAPGPPHEVDGSVPVPVVRFPADNCEAWYVKAMRHIEAHRDHRPIVTHFFGFSSAWPQAQAAAIRHAKRRLGAGVVLKVPTLGDPSRCLSGVHTGLQAVVDGWIALTPAIADELLGLGVPGRSVVRLPNGVPLDRYTPVHPLERLRARRELGLPWGNRPVVGFAGRFVRCKRIDVVIEALEMLPARERPVLALVGEPDPNCEDAFDPSPYLCDDVVWVPRRAEMAQVYPALDAYVSMSESEGMSNAMLESLASGLPVLASDIPGHAELVRPGWNGWLFPPRKARALSGCLADLARVGRAGQLSRMGQRSRQLACRFFDVDVLASRYLDLYGALASGVRSLPRQPASGTRRTRATSGGHAFAMRDDELSGQRM
jgi:glycosyltransferase involved in cell wall biosynthesis